MNFKKAFSHRFTQIYTDTSKTYANKVNHLFVLKHLLLGEAIYLFKCLFYQWLSVSIRGQLRFSG